MYDNVLRNISNPTDEEVTLYDMSKLPDVIPNLYWLIPLALDKDIGKTFSYEEI